MSLSQYVNIEGEVNEKTPWISRAHGIFYRDLNYPDGYHLSYTYIKKEIPTLNGYAGPLTEIQYWQNAPKMYAKLSLHRTFSTKYPYYQPSLKVYWMGVKLDDSLIIHLTSSRFEIDSSVPDGYIYIQYVLSSPSQCVGDQRLDLDAAKVVSEYVAPIITVDEIVRCRKAINTIQAQTEYLPSTWIGGPYNTIKSRSTNIIKSVTHIYGQHIVEIQDALNKVSDHIDSLSAYTVVNPTFTEVVDNSPYSVQYLEEIRKAINDLEFYVIELVA